MSKVEELIKKYKKQSLYAFGGTNIEAVVEDLREIQSEQEELQNKADAHDELSKHLEFTVKSFEEQQAILQEQINFEKLKNQGSPLAEAAEDMKEFAKVFGAAMDRNKRKAAVAELLEEFLESDWDFYDESETEQGAMEYAEKIIELFEEQNKPVEVPVIVSKYLDYARQCLDLNILTVALYQNVKSNMGTIAADEIAEWITKNPNEFAKAYQHGNYTVKHEREKIYLKIQPEYLEAVRSGIKQFEIRKNDRDYQVDDILILQEYTCGSFTDNSLEVEITYITDYAQQPGYVVLGIAPVDEK